jgi:hypothetical protein
MAFDAGLAQRITEELGDRPDIAAGKMFGETVFMLSGNMCCGVKDSVLAARVGPDAYADASSRPCSREMDLKGKALNGFAYVYTPRSYADSQLRE